MQHAEPAPLPLTPDLVLTSSQIAPQAAWRWHEYAVISTSVLTMRLAEAALQPAARDALLARNKRLVRDGYAAVRRWVDASGGLLSLHPPEATALAFVR